MNVQTQVGIVGAGPAGLLLSRRLRCINLGGITGSGPSRSRSAVSVQVPPFPAEIILLCVRWYCKYGISYRNLSEMMSERGVQVDPSTIFRWVQRYAPEIDKRVRPYQGKWSGSWRVDETYVRVGGKWKYLFRAVDKHGQLIDFMLLDCRNTRAAYRFLRKAVKTMSDYPPSSITTDKLASYPKAIWRLQREGLLSKDVDHRTSKYLNNVI
jgi:transposase, IS6 family